MNKVRLGFIGCGKLAQAQHLRNAFNNPNIEIYYCCDINEKILREVKEKFKPVKTTLKADDIFFDRDVEGVVISTVHDIREELIQKAADAGKPMYVEKPIATTKEEAYRITRIIKKSGINIVVGHNRRLAPATCDMKRIYDGQKKNPYSAPWRFNRGEKKVTLPEESITMMLLRINDDCLSFKEYAFDEGKSGGMLLSEMCHFIDYACYLIGQEPIKVYAEGSSRINSSIILTFQDGSIATILDSNIGSLGYPKELIEIYINGATIVNDHFMELRLSGVRDERRIVYKLWQDDYPNIRTELGGIWDFHKKTEKAKEEAIRTGDMAKSLLMPDKGWYAMLDDFACGVIRKSKESPCGIRDACRSAIVALKARESILTGLPLKISQNEYDFVIV